MTDPKPKQPSHLIPVVAVILSMSALVGVFAYSQWPTKSEDTVTPVVVHKATNTTANANTVVNTNVTANTNSATNTNSVSDVTKDWKAYSNSTYEFSFSYPKGYSTIIPTTTQQQTGYVESSTGVVSESGTLTALATFKVNPVTEAEYPGLTVNVFPLNKYAYNDPPGGSIYVYHATTKDFWVAEGATAMHDAQLKTISGVNATGSITGIGDMGALTNSILFINTDKNQVVELNFSSGAPLDGAIGKATKNVDIWKSIAATFSFTSPTADWKTYTSTDNSYTLKYPADWNVVKTDANVTFSGKSTSGKMYSTPMVVVKTKNTLYPSDSCLTSHTNVTVAGEERPQQVEGCSYAGAEVATFFKTGSSYIVVSWTQDVPDSYSTYNTILSTFTK